MPKRTAPTDSKSRSRKGKIQVLVAWDDTSRGAHHWVPLSACMPAIPTGTLQGGCPLLLHTAKVMINSGQDT